MKSVKPIQSLEVPCHFAGKAGQVRLHVGEPAKGLGAVHFQRQWLKETRGGELDDEILAALDALSSGPGDH